MKKIFCFKPIYFLLTILLFAIEILIALYVKDNVIRPYGGDYLVVILIYCFLRSFTRIAVMPAAIVVLIFSFLIEFLQYIDFVNKIGLGHSNLSRIVLGTSFEWIDLVSYTLGVLTLLALEYLFNRSTDRKTILSSDNPS